MTPTRLFDFIEHQRKNAPLKKAFTTKYNGIWTSISTEEFCDQAKKVSRALISLGIEAQDKIAMISSTNRTEWNIVDIGLLTIGAVNVPIYPTISSEDYEYILNHSESEYCFVSDQEVYDKVIAIKDKVKSLKKVYSFDSIKGCSNWKELIELGTSSEHDTVLEERKIAVAPEDLATIIYTSGTTGIPKGVMLSHDNVVSNVISSSKRLPLNIGQASALSFLPICHIFERVILYIYMQNSVSVYYAESLEKIADNLREIKPNVMTAVPRLLEKVYDKIYARGAELTGIKQKLFYWAVDLGLQYEPYGENGAWYEFKLKIAKKLILSKWKEALGGNLELIASGSAALQPRLARIFTAAGMTLVEGYGLTETSPVISVNDMRKNKFKIGSVGQIIDGVHVKIAKDGEILCKGPNIMMGYYKDLEKTAEVMTDDYFHTGDIGEFDHDGYLTITGRIKDQFKTDKGKYISPAPIELEFLKNNDIEQICVVGTGIPQPIALIVPSAIGRNKEKYELNDSLLMTMNLINPDLHTNEKISKIVIMKEEWSVDNGLMTPTLKVKRNRVEGNHNHMYDEWFKNNDQIVYE